MYRNAKRISVHAALLCCLCGSMRVAQITAGQKAEVKGLIVDRDGDSLAIKTTDGNKVVVQINDNTKVQQPKGVFRHKTMAETSLIPGLAVSVKGVGTDNGQIAADSVRFSADDLKTAQQIEAGLHPTSQRSRPPKQGSPATRRQPKSMARAFLQTKRTLKRMPRTLKKPTSVSHS